MKKAAQAEAQKMFLEARGKITNKAIADALGVNALTVGRWKGKGNWEDKLNDLPDPAEVAAKKKDTTIRKKSARDTAMGLFLESGGAITNRELADHVGVNAATISKWKRAGDWAALVEPREIMTEPEVEAEAPEETAVDLLWDRLAAPEQILQMNDKIDALLKRDYLTPGEIVELAQAKTGLLEAVGVYMHLVKDMCYECGEE